MLVDESMLLLLLLLFVLSVPSCWMIMLLLAGCDTADHSISLLDDIVLFVLCFGCLVAR